MNEKALIKACQNGERQAFDELIEMYYPYVSGFLLKTVCDKLLAEDMTQETFLRMIRSIEKYDLGGGAGFGTWPALPSMASLALAGLSAFSAFCAFCADSGLPPELIITMGPVMLTPDGPSTMELGPALRLMVIPAFSTMFMPACRSKFMPAVMAALIPASRSNPLPTGISCEAKPFSRRAPRVCQPRKPGEPVIATDGIESVLRLSS